MQPNYPFSISGAIESTRSFFGKNDVNQRFNERLRHVRLRQLFVTFGDDIIVLSHSETQNLRVPGFLCGVIPISPNKTSPQPVAKAEQAKEDVSNHPVPGRDASWQAIHGRLP